jgi:erythromycin esterase-like protein
VSAAGEEDEEQRSAAEAAASEDALAALCNARSVVHAESYYRQMVLGRRNTWNLRDSAMAETVLLVKAHLEGGVFAAVDDDEEEEGADSLFFPPSSSSPQKTKRIIVWAHNSHLGDARATAMSRRGEHNVGQLLRQIFERKGRAAAVLNLGFSTFSGTVCAAARWGGPALCRGVRPGMRGSYEELLHRVSRLLQGSGGEKGEGEQQQQQEQQLAAVAAAISASSPGAFLLDLRRSRPSSSETSHAMIDALSEPRLERAIGVLYVPRSERYSHYFAAKVTAQFDLLVHVDETSAVSPLDFDGDEGGGDGTLERWRARVIGPDDPVESEE